MYSRGEHPPPHFHVQYGENWAELAVFRQGKVDADSQTVVWPNGADVAPEVWTRGFPEESAKQHAS